MPGADKDYVIGQILGEAQIAPGGQREMPKYRCHKEVWALKIAEVGTRHTETGSVFLLYITDVGYSTISVTAEYMTKHQPKAGGYYVVYDDGYASFSPAKAFEAGYTRI